MHINKTTIIEKLKEKDHKLGTLFSSSGIGQILIVLLTAFLIAYFGSTWGKYQNSKDYKNAINNLSIGMNNQYIIEDLGNPQYVCNHNDIGVFEEVFISDECITRAYFSNEKLIGYFVTVLKEKTNYGTNGLVSTFLNNKPIGSTCYEDISGKPSHINGYVGNGTGYIVYSEEYYYASSGYYNTYYFMFLDYGIQNNIWVDYDTYVNQNEINIEALDETYYDPYISRKESFPNTYGVCETQYANNLYKLISTYSTFDFSSYRK